MNPNELLQAAKALLERVENEIHDPSGWKQVVRMRDAIARAEASASQPAAVPSEAEPEPESEPAPTDPERALLGWVADNCGLTVAQEAELARRLESLRQPAPPLTGPNYMDQEEWGHAPAPATDAEIDDAIEALEDAVQIQTRHEAAASDRWIALGKAKHDARTALRALIARRVAEARAETQQELADLHAELDEVRDERNEACAELARLRAGGCARDQTTTQWCAEAVELQRENERLRAELAAKGGDHGK